MEKTVQDDITDFSNTHALFYEMPVIRKYSKTFPTSAYSCEKHFTKRSKILISRKQYLFI